VQCCSALRGSLYATLGSVVTVSLLVISIEGCDGECCGLDKSEKHQRERKTFIGK